MLMIMMITYPDSVSVGGSDRYSGLDDWGAEKGSADDTVTPRSSQGSSQGSGVASIASVGCADEAGGSGGASQDGGEYKLHKTNHYKRIYDNLGGLCKSSGPRF
jgi:hypothetical protein